MSHDQLPRIGKITVTIQFLLLRKIIKKALVKVQQSKNYEHLNSNKLFMEKLKLQSDNRKPVIVSYHTMNEH